MNVYDTIIKETREILSEYTPRELPVKPHPKWPLLNENQFLLRRDIAFELGSPRKPGTCYNACTSNPELVGKDRILLYGEDLDEIKEDKVFTRITFLNVDDIADPDKAYKSIKRLEFARFKIIPEGYMILSSSMDNKENVRVSKDAVKGGLTFEHIGNLIIDKYKEDMDVNNVEVIFITEDIPEMKDLMDESRRVDEITDAFDHILKDIILDCDLCPLHPICDDVEELRQLHFDVNHSDDDEK